MSKKPTPYRCLFCNRRPQTRPFGLCWPCYYTPAVRAIYGPSTKKAATGA